MADYTKATTPIGFPRDGVSWTNADGTVVTPALADGDKLTYDPTGVEYLYKKSSETWTGPIG